MMVLNLTMGFLSILTLKIIWRCRIFWEPVNSSELPRQHRIMTFQCCISNSLMAQIQALLFTKIRDLDMLLIQTSIYYLQKQRTMPSVSMIRDHACKFSLESTFNPVLLELSPKLPKYLYCARHCVKYLACRFCLSLTAIP